MELEYGGQRISVAAGECVIGTDAGVALRLAGASLLPRHAVVRAAGGHVVVHPAVPGAAITVNGAPIGADPTPVMHGDRIGIAGHEIIVTDPARGGATRVMATVRPTAPSLPAPLADTEPTGRLVSLNDGREYRIAVVPFVLGRDATAEIVIGSPDASRRHAEIVARPDGDVLVDLSANGTFVNGQRIANRHPLKALDVIRIGAEEFRYYPALQPAVVGPPAGAAFRLGDTLVGIPSLKTPAKPVPAVERPLAHIRVKSGAAKGERFAVRTPLVNIGRAEFNDVRLPDPSVSSSHAKLQLKEGVWTLIDLDSTNGTAVDGLPVEEEAPLSPGATIKLGEVSLSFEPQDERPEVTDRTAVIAKPAVPAEFASAPAAVAAAPVAAPVVAAAPAAVAPAPPAEPAVAPRARRVILGADSPPAAPKRRSNVLLLSVAIVVLIAALAILVFVV